MRKQRYKNFERQQKGKLKEMCRKCHKGELNRGLIGTAELWKSVAEERQEELDSTNELLKIYRNNLYIVTAGLVISLVLLLYKCTP